MDKVQHFEIPADDVERAKKFYSQSFDWGMKDWPMPDGSTYIGLYTGPVDDKNMWTERGFINGGMFKRSDKVPLNGPTFAVTVEEIETALAKVKEANGIVLGEVKTIPDMGKYAYVKDTEGNVIGVWQNFNQSKEQG